MIVAIPAAIVAVNEGRLEQNLSNQSSLELLWFFV